MRLSGLPSLMRHQPAGRVAVTAAATLAVALAVLVPVGGAGATGGPSISGTVWSATDGSTLGGIDVTLFEYQTFNFFGQKFRATVEVTGTTTADDGTYTLSGLKPSPKGGYFVCFAMPSDFPSAIGVCWADQFWLESPPNPFGAEQIPQTSAPIKLRGGMHLTGINADLVDPDVVNSATAGSISGTVTHAGGRRPLAGAVVTAFDSTNAILGQAVTVADGSYEIDNLLAAQGPYHVCFDGALSRAGFPPHRFGTQCYDGVAGAATVPPADAAPVPVTAGEDTGSINANLR